MQAASLSGVYGIDTTVCMKPCALHDPVTVPKRTRSLHFPQSILLSAASNPRGYGISIDRRVLLQEKLRNDDQRKEGRQEPLLENDRLYSKPGVPNIANLVSWTEIENALCLES